MVAEEADVRLLLFPLSFASRAVSGAGYVVGSGVSGIALAGALVGALTGFAALGSLAVYIVMSRRQIRAEYAEEIARAEARGKAEQKEWTDYWKAIATGRLRLPPQPGPSEEDQ
jgi:hypothetical protein